MNAHYFMHNLSRLRSLRIKLFSTNTGHDVVSDLLPVPQGNSLKVGPGCYYSLL